MIKFPYGISDFYKVSREGYFYIDRTPYLRRLEEIGPQLLFLRPRRFGKSLLLSVLENYYDLARADEFEQLFGRLAVGQQPTPLHNRYFVLKWDFSVVEALGDEQAIRRSLYNHLNDQMRGFAVHYQHHLPLPITINPDDALSSLASLLMAVRQTPYRLYLLIDEYDNFANEVLMSRIAGEILLLTGDLQPLCDFVERRLFNVFDNRDYVSANELTVKTAFLTLLFNDRLYMVDSETAIQRTYADLTLIRRPDLRQTPELFDFILEFKYVKLSDLKLDGVTACQLSRADLAILPAVQAQLSAARAQLQGYRRALQSYYGAVLRLRTYAVVAIGFERVIWEEV